MEKPNERPPLAVAICALVRDGKILLIKRIKGDYVGMWGLPGGKIERDEHTSDAAVREIREESGIDSRFVSLLGHVSEHLMEDGKIVNHFLLHVCELEPKTTEIKSGGEGELKWFDLGNLPKEEIIPSDLLMIEKMVKQRGGERQGSHGGGAATILVAEGGVPHTNYYNCVIEKTGSGSHHELKKFELVAPRVAK